MSIELKIKSKHLSVESKIIRFEERKLSKRIKNTEITEEEKTQPYYLCKQYILIGKLGSLVSHRTKNVRNENRATFLARAYISGKSYKSVENKRKLCKEYNFIQDVLPRVHAMVKKYKKYNFTMEELNEWIEKE